MKKGNKGKYERAKIYPRSCHNPFVLKHRELKSPFDNLKVLFKRKEKKVYQCRYCTNSSNEGEGIKVFNQYTKQMMWVCMPCYEAFREEKARAKGE